MVVVGNRGRGGLRSAVLGSTSQQIAHHAQCPVVVVRDSAATSANQVVVGVDGSPASLAALREAFAQAQLRGASLLMVHAWSTSFAGTLGISGQYFDRVRASEVDEGWALLNQSLAELQATDQSVEIIERLEQGSPAAAIIEASKEAVLTVVGSRGRGGFAGLVLGSVSGSVLAHADSAVMVIRA
jgi:nucleotide-binding universal stress UspA family protein